MSTLLSREEFTAALNAIGERQYHDLHPFHKLLHGGELGKGQIQAWALNRFYYQVSIPRKDLTIMARMDDPALRRVWMQRVLDHDGLRQDGQPDESKVGGIERWLRLTDGLGLDRDYVRSLEGILPATRYAVDAYVHFVRDHSLLEAVASSLTELFAPAIHRERIAGFERYYAFANDSTLSYFRKRLDEAPRDVDFGLTYVLENARTGEQQQACIRALRFKTELLWAQLDALHHAYVTPGLIPPGAFVPDDRTPTRYSR
ncbi:pyrroloquinoline-quinone synthase PqqC [Azospirillum sp. RWY-5-1]|uniref:Pyrroloquinoline-quinone synthase n=1 Tax=Azospirillum oleiclasticum TaxID=2735135 RepID=A0ABX2T6E5_9PROT|nr:pyrroloquinoline-quinone synthase PqqC [Azospirillum oleiclasticum]NYZ12745.1 pyrroloquinoline-quinone synthase PqqC [Azospirillum oleiclasticum]NYZ19905.1 pyrroloquinoline-quinone synthase PqqC [Azospirillum oleiclasticum]